MEALALLSSGEHVTLPLSPHFNLIPFYYASEDNPSFIFPSSFAEVMIYPLPLLERSPLLILPRPDDPIANFLPAATEVSKKNITNLSPVW